jgi:hypothetical protein
MSNHGNFDEFIKNQLGNASPEVPSRVWENIVAARERKPKAFWWNTMQIKGIAAGVALLIGCCTITWLVTHHTTNSNKTDLTTGLSTNTTPGATNNTGNPVNASGIGVSTSQSATAGTRQTNQSVGIKNSNNNSTINGTPDNSGTHSIAANAPMVNRKSIREKKTGYSKSTIRYNSQQEEDNLTADQTTGPVIDNTIDNNSIGTSADLAPFYDQLSGLTAHVHADKLLKKNKLLLPECPTVEKTPSRKRDYVQLYFSPDYGIRSLSDAASPAYRKSRDSSSAFKSGFSAGVSYTKVFANGMSLREGLNYSRITEWFSPAKNNVLSITITTDSLTGHSDTTRKYKITYNHYSSLDIPITVGYEFAIGNSNRFIANINGGAIINVFSWQTGDVLDTANNTISISTNKTPYSQYSFKTAMGLGLTANFSFYYKLNDQISVVAEPYIRYNLQPMTQNVSAFTERYTTIGMHLGVRFDLQ